MTVRKKTKTKLSSEKYSGVLVFEVLAKLLTLFRHSALPCKMDCQEKTKTKLSSEKYSGGLSFRGLSFRGLSFRLLEILHFSNF